MKRKDYTLQNLVRRPSQEISWTKLITNRRKGSKCWGIVMDGKVSKYQKRSWSNVDIINGVMFVSTSQFRQRLQRLGQLLPQRPRRQPWLS